MMVRRLELTEQQKREVASIARAHDLDLLVLFGSQASGRARHSSDVDLVARRREGFLSFTELVDIPDELRTIFPGREIDLADLRRADPLFLRKIFECALPLFEEPGAFSQARLHAFHRYQDYRPMLRLERRAVRRALGLDAS
jgi:predicted nucleotidyltransferase